MDAYIKVRRRRGQTNWMRWIRTLTWLCRPRLILPGASVLLVLLGVSSWRLSAAATPTQDTVIQVLFGDLPESAGVDANGDGALTVADILFLDIPPTPTLTPIPSPTPTPVGLLFAGTVADLVPHAVGDTLIYRVTDPTGKVTIETTDVVSLDDQGGFIVDDQQVNGQQVIKHELQSYTDTGTQLLLGGGTDVLRKLRTTCASQSLRLVMPLIAGQTFSTTVACDVRTIDQDIDVGTLNRTDTFTPIEVVDSLTVETGTYMLVVHIHGATSFGTDMETDEIYLAPGIGAILQLSSAGGFVTRHELIGGTIGGVSVMR